MTNRPRMHVVGEPIRLAPEERARNLVDLVHGTVERHAGKTAYTWKPSRRAARAAGRATDWQSVTFTGLWVWIERVAAAFDRLGIRSGDHVAIFSRSRPEWLVCDLAALSLGAVTCPIYHAERDEIVRFILVNTSARVAVVESAQMARRLSLLRETGIPLERIVVLDPGEDLPPEAVTLDAPESDGEPTAAWRSTWTDRWRSISREDVATVVHTSGTTDVPKGVILSHGNVVAHCEAAMQAMPFTPDDLGMSVLPLSHIAERAGGQIVPLGVGASITFAEPVMERWPANLLEVRPTVMVTIPRFFTRMYRRIRDELDAGPAWRRAVFDWATGLGAKRYANHVAGRPDSAWLRLQLAVANRLVFRTIKQRVGGRLRFFAAGAAPLPRETGELFYAMDMLILEAYGLTEVAAVLCMNRPDDFRFGTVGKPFPEVEIRIDPETGEIQARGPQIFRGYLNMPEETAATIDRDGWFHTGDVGILDDEGRLTITDRIKNLLVLSNGKKVMPGPMENALAASPYIAQSVILGDHHEQPGVLVVPDHAHIRGWATKHGIHDEALEDLGRRPEVIGLIEGEVRRLLGDFAAYERPRRVALLPRELSVEEDEVTPLFKPKRRTVIAHFPEQVARLWEGEHATA